MQGYCAPNWYSEYRRVQDDLEDTYNEEECIEIKAPAGVDWVPKVVDRGTDGEHRNDGCHKPRRRDDHAHHRHGAIPRHRKYSPIENKNGQLGGEKYCECKGDTDVQCLSCVSSILIYAMQSYLNMIVELVKEVLGGRAWELPLLDHLG